MTEISLNSLYLLLDVSLKTLLLWCVAWFALRLFRIQDANLKHRIWAGVLAGMLVLPLLAYALPPVPLPFSLDTEWLAAKQNTESSTASETIDKPPLSDDRPIDSQVTSVSPGPFRDLSPNELSESGDRLAAETVGTKFLPKPANPEPETESEFVEPQASEIDDTLAKPPTEASHASGGINSLARIPHFLFGGWLIIAGLFLLRLAAGLWTASRLRNRSSLIDHQIFESRFSDLPAIMWSRELTVRECSRVRVPVTAGWLRPTVFLPSQWQTWSSAKLQAVLVHELTHIARRDYIIAVLAELNRCLYWFHPVAWWLCQHLSNLAEEACDDAAIGHTGDPAGYAGHLLEVASNLADGRGRLVSPGMPMARESKVESRITAILDFTRPLSRRMTWKAAAAVTTVCIPVIALAAALQPGAARDEPSAAPEKATAAEEVVAQKPAPNAAETKDDAEASKESANAERFFRIYGQVVNNDKQGIPAARVRLYRSQYRKWYAGDGQAALVHEFQLDNEGHFDHRIPLEAFPEDARQTLFDSPGTDVLVVDAPGYVYATRTFVDHSEQPPKQVVRLWEEVPIRGRILDPEGQPVENASISIFDLIRSDRDKIKDWISMVSFEPFKDRPDMQRMMSVPGGARANRFPSKRDIQLPAEAADGVKTNAKGEFELHGTGPDDLLLLNIEGEGIAKTTLHVLNRETPRFYAEHHSNISFFGAYYGREFDFVAQPSVPVFGVVRDLETEKPLAGVQVAAGSIYGTQMSHEGYIVTTTDREGRYWLEGLPIPPANKGGNRLAVRPYPLPYIENDWLEVPAGNGVDPIEFDIELQRAVLAKGRLTDQSTGKPVPAKFYYSPFLTNEHLSEYHRYADRVTTMLGNDSRYYTDEDGYFEIPVIPGRGVIAAKCLAGGYRTSFGAAAIPEFADESKRNFAEIPTSDHIIPSLYHSLLEVNPAAGDTEMDIKMHVDSGRSLPIKFFDPLGNPLSGVHVNGLTGAHKWDSVKADHAEIKGLATGEARPLRVHHNERKLSRLVRLIPQQGQTEITVTLLPQTIVSGRLIDPGGAPVEGVQFSARHNLDPDFMNVESESKATDADGKFEISLPVGTTYGIYGNKAEDIYLTVTKDLEVTEPQMIDLGDLVVDPKGERYSNVTAKRKPIVTDRKPDASNESKEEPAPKPGQKSPPLKSSNPSSTKTDQTSHETAEPLIFSGNVVGPDGKPVGGAAIHLIYGWRPEANLDPRPLAVTDRQGQFRFTFVPTPQRNGQGQLVAVKEGYAFAHEHAQAFEKTGRVTLGATAGEREWMKRELKDATDTLQLLPDNEPIRGRIVNTEGQPVAGAVVRVAELYESKSDDLSEWEAAASSDGADIRFLNEQLSQPITGTIRAHLAVPVVKTNEDGWFALRGLGNKRLAKVVISHPEIATATFHVRPQPVKTIEVPYNSENPNGSKEIYYPNRFTYVAAPCQILVGRVTAKETRKPVPNCFIRCDSEESSSTIGNINTRTNANGEYRLTGMPLGYCRVDVIPPFESSLMPLQLFESRGDSPLETITRDVELPRAVIAEGRAVDTRTGQPVAGWIQYVAYADNPHLDIPRGINLAQLEYHYRTSDEGRYAIPVLSGNGLLLFRVDDHERFERGVGSESIPESRFERSNSLLNTQPFPASTYNYNLFVEVNPQPGDDRMTVDLKLTSGIDISGRVVRPDGSEVEKYWLFGASQYPSWQPPGTNGPLIEGYFGKHPQRVIAWVPEENLVGTILLEGEQPGPLTIELEPACHVTGRLVGEEGLPLQDLMVSNRERVNFQFGVTEADPHAAGRFPADWDELKETLHSDEDGRFRVSGLVPGLRYSAGVTRYDKDNYYWKPVGEAFEKLILTPGESKDLGDIVIKIPKE